MANVDTAPQANAISASAQNRSGGSYLRQPKRLFDLFLALLMAPVLLPLIALLWVLVRLDGGPGLFGHSRIGRNGESFRCLKIRTMVPDADVQLKRHLAANPEAAALWARDFKLENDPRVTRIGRFLRKTSLDELPQIWNVVRGDMSFIGPRPVTAPELARYGAKARYYKALRPGVTGLWQVSGRNDVSYDERVALDVQYFRTASLGQDLTILCRTVGAVLNMTGK